MRILGRRIIQQWATTRMCTGVRLRLELLDEACEVWEDGLQAEATPRGELSANAVLCGLCRVERNGMIGPVVAWDGERKRWAVKVGGESILVTEDKIFAADGLVPKSAVIEWEIL